MRLSCRRLSAEAARLDEQSAQAERYADNLFASAEICFFDSRFGVVQHVPVFPAEAGDVALDKLANVAAVRTDVEAGSASVPHAEDVGIAFANPDRTAALIAAVGFPGLNKLASEHAGRVEVAIAIEGHLRLPAEYADVGQRDIDARVELALHDAEGRPVQHELVIGSDAEFPRDVAAGLANRGSRGYAGEEPIPRLQSVRSEGTDVHAGTAFLRWAMAHAVEQVPQVIFCG